MCVVHTAVTLSAVYQTHLDKLCPGHSGFILLGLRSTHGSVTEPRIRYLDIDLALLHESGIVIWIQLGNVDPLLRHGFKMKWIHGYIVDTWSLYEDGEPVPVFRECLNGCKYSSDFIMFDVIVYNI